MHQQKHLALRRIVHLEVVGPTGSPVDLFHALSSGTESETPTGKIRQFATFTTIVILIQTPRQILVIAGGSSASPPWSRTLWGVFWTCCTRNFLALTPPLTTGVHHPYIVMGLIKTKATKMN